MINLTTMSPAEIDEKLAEIHGRTAVAYDAWVNESAKAQKIEDALRGRTFWTDKDLASSLARADKLQKAYLAAKAEAVPFNEEYEARGRWTRAFIVIDGHVHSSMSCSTCNNGRYMTRFGWLTELSDHDEAEIVEQAGERACTVCYPSAPVNAGPSKLFHKDELAAEQARQERAEKAAAKAAKIAANAISPAIGTSYDRIDTVTKAKAFLTDAAQWNVWRPEGHPSFPLDKTLEVAEALAAKLGTDWEAEIDAAVKRAAKRK